MALENVFVQGRARDETSFPIREAGLRFEARLSAGGSIGLEPGDRELRKWVKNDARGKRVLVLGSDAGSFAVAAAAGGAIATTSVGLGDPAQRLAAESFALNELDPGLAHFVHSDLETYFEEDRGPYELVFASLPSLDGFAWLGGRIARSVPPGGIFYLTTRAPRPRLPAEALEPWAVEDVTASSIPEEFRNQKLHRAWRMTRRQEA